MGVGYAWWNWDAPDSYTYYNPYVVYVEDQPYDYAEPVATPSMEDTDAEEVSTIPEKSQAGEAIETPDGRPVPGDIPAATDEASKATQPMKHFQAAREEFKKGNYPVAEKEIDLSIKETPNDVALHEFLALTLFAQGKYDQAAGVVNSVIASGPGWDWETMIHLYGNPEQYTKQLRDLEAYVRQNSNNAGARFLLAYHYLVMDFVDNAETQLKQVVKLEPKDVLSKRLLEVIEQSKKEKVPAALP